MPPARSPPPHDAFWAAARAAHGEAAGTWAQIEVLLLHRRMPAEAVLAGITAALDAGAASPELVAIEARKAGQAAADLPTGPAAQSPAQARPDNLAPNQAAATSPQTRSSPTSAIPLTSGSTWCSG